jgi:pyruvate ferredoxin oxidoreductase gamma subunit
MKSNKDKFEIIFFGRGGQGSKVAAEILAQAVKREGKHVQAFPQFGPERSGAPTRIFFRSSETEIRLHEPVLDPDVVVVMDETILDSQDVTFNLSSDEFMIVNTKKSAEEVKKQLNYQGKVFPVDADGISMEIIGQPRPNTVILGKIVQVTEIASLESVIEEFRKIFEEKIGKEGTEKNVRAIEQAYDSI